MHNPIQGQLCFCFVIMGTIHLLFNWKADIDILKMFQAWQHHAEREESKSSVYPYQVDFDEGIVIYGSASTDNNDLGSTVRAGMISSADSARAGRGSMLPGTTASTTGRRASIPSFAM